MEIKDHSIETKHVEQSTGTKTELLRNRGRVEKMEQGGGATLWASQLRSNTIRRSCYGGVRNLTALQCVRFTFNRVERGPDLREPTIIVYVQSRPADVPT